MKTAFRADRKAVFVCADRPGSWHDFVRRAGLHAAGPWAAPPAAYILSISFSTLRATIRDQDERYRKARRRRSIDRRRRQDQAEESAALALDFVDAER